MHKETQQSLAEENEALRRQLTAFQALIQPPPIAATAAPIATRWQGVHWKTVVERHKSYVVSAALADGEDVPLLDLEEPNTAEVSTLELAGRAPSDIHLLLALLAPAARIERAAAALIECWAALEAPTPLDREMTLLASAVAPTRTAALALGRGELFEEF